MSEETALDRTAQVAAELGLLCSICDPQAPREQRWELARALDHRVFIEPEHQVVYESIRSLMPIGTVSAARLALHLNNRGFPDMDMQKYFPDASVDARRRETPEKDSA